MTGLIVGELASVEVAKASLVSVTPIALSFIIAASAIFAAKSAAWISVIGVVVLPTESPSPPNADVYRDR